MIDGAMSSSGHPDGERRKRWREVEDDMDDLQLGEGTHTLLHTHLTPTPTHTHTHTHIPSTNSLDGEIQLDE